MPTMLTGKLMKRQADKVATWIKKNKHFDKKCKIYSWWNSNLMTWKLMKCLI